MHGPARFGLSGSEPWTTWVAPSLVPRPPLPSSGRVGCARPARAHVLGEPETDLGGGSGEGCRQSQSRGDGGGGGGSPSRAPRLPSLPRRPVEDRNYHKAPRTPLSQSCQTPAAAAAAAASCHQRCALPASSPPRPSGAWPVRARAHPHPSSPLPPRGALSHFGVKSYLKTPPQATVAVPPELRARVPRTFQLCGNCLEVGEGGSSPWRHREVWGAVGERRSACISPGSGAFSRSVPLMVGGAALAPHPGLGRLSPAFYFPWQGATFGLHRSPHKFPLGNVVLIGARRRRTACARSSSIQLTRIELLQRTRRGAGRGGRAGAGGREGEAEKRGSGLPGAQSLKGEPRSPSW